MYSRVRNARGESLVIFSIFFTPPQILLRPPRLLILAKVVKSPISLLRIKNTKQYLFRVLLFGGCLKRPHCIAFMFWGDGSKDTIVLHLYFEVSFMGGQVL